MPPPAIAPPYVLTCWRFLPSLGYLPAAIVTGSPLVVIILFCRTGLAPHTTLLPPDVRLLFCAVLFCDSLNTPYLPATPNNCLLHYAHRYPPYLQRAGAFTVRFTHVYCVLLLWPEQYMAHYLLPTTFWNLLHVLFSVHYLLTTREDVIQLWTLLVGHRCFLFLDVTVSNDDFCRNHRTNGLLRFGVYSPACLILHVLEEVSCWIMHPTHSNSHTFTY